MIKKGSIIPVKIEKFALGGQGLAFVETDGVVEEGAEGGEVAKRRVPVFVDDVCVGDEAEVKLVKKKSSFGEGVLEKITKPSPERIEAKCKHFGVCGGCSWQFLSYEKQLKWKEQLVRETLAHIGGFSEEILSEVFRGIVGCDEPWFYRNKMEWSFSVDGAGSLSGGFHMKRMHYDTVNVQECFLQSEMSVRIFKAVREFFDVMYKHGEEVVYQMKRHRGFLRSVFVREGTRTGEYMVILQSSAAEFDREGFVKIFDAFPEVVSVVQIVVHDEKGKRTELEERVLKGRNYYREEMRIGEDDHGEVSALRLSPSMMLQFNVKPLAFFQPNTKMAEKIYGEVARLLRESFSESELASMKAYDLYCGTGTIGIVMSHFVKDVIGIELNANAIESAKENATLNQRTNIEFREGDVKHVLDELVGASVDLMTIDPPRSGMEEKVLQHILNVGPRAIVYISCNPATFARDAKLLCAQGYALMHVRAFDQFPQTAHIETVALLKKME